MALPNKRIEAQGVTRHPWEQEAVVFLRDELPDSDPIRLWSLVNLINPSGGVLEIDALVLARHALYLIEIKSHPGTFTSPSVGEWVHTWPDGRRSSLANPLPATDYKAKVLASLLRREMSSPPPRVVSLVFLSSADADSRLDGTARTQVVTRSTLRRAITHADFPGGERIQHRRVDRLMMRATVKAMAKLGLRKNQGRLKLGDYLIDKVIERGDGYEDRLATHEHIEALKRRVRLYLVPQATSAAERDKRQRAADREAKLLTVLGDHRHVLGVKDYVSDSPLAGPCLVLEHLPDAEPLGAFLRLNPELSFDDRLAIIEQVADALAYCHSKEVAHRNLHPGTVLVRYRADATGSSEPAIDVRLYNFQFARRAESISPTVHPTHLAIDATAAAVYRAPELIEDPSKASPQSDIFSLGCLAYHILTGQAPGTNLQERHRLFVDGRLSLAAASDAFAAGDTSVPLATDPSCDTLDDVIGFATELNPLNRPDDVRQWLDLLFEVATSPVADDPGEATVDPLTAKPGDRLGSDLVVAAVLGTGSTARALRVERGDRTYALKVPLSPTAEDHIRSEAKVLTELKTDRVVSLYETLQLEGRFCLLLGYAGKPLSRVLRDEGPQSLEYAARWGSDLLRALESLEESGVQHRDIKPANLGVLERTGKARRHLQLFDFSLSGYDPTKLDIGTPAYRDPFLIERAGWDAAADRYSAAVTLYELLTGTRPLYGDGSGAAIATDAEVTIEAERFDAAARDRLAAFFSRSLDRDVAARYASAEQMGREWSVCFAEGAPASLPAALTATLDASATPPPATPAGPDAPRDYATLRPETPVDALHLGSRARNALDRSGVTTLAELLALPRNELSVIRGVGRGTAREILREIEAIASARPELTGATPPPPFWPDYRGRDASVGYLDQLAPPVRAALEGAGLDRLVLVARAPDARVRRVLAGVDVGDEAPGDGKAAVASVRDALRRHTDEGQAPTSPATIEAWVDALLPLKSRSTPVQNTRKTLGLDPLPTQPARYAADTRDAAKHLGVTRQALYIALGKMRGKWQAHPALSELHRLVGAAVQTLGGAAPIASVALTLPSLLPHEQAVQDEAVRQRVARALVRIAQDTAGDDVPLMLGRLRGEPWVANSGAHLGAARELGAVADALAATEPLPSSPSVRERLASAVANTPLAGLGQERLIQIAAAASQNAAPSARLELYPRSMDATRALRLSAGALSSGFITEARLRGVVGTRYPEAQDLPERPELDVLVADLGLVWSEAVNAYQRRNPQGYTEPSTVAALERHDTVLSRPVRSKPTPSAKPDAAAREAREFWDRLRLALERRDFRVLEVSAPYASDAASELRHRLKVDPQPLDTAMLRAAQELIAEYDVDPDLVYATDREGPESGGWDNLVDLMRQAADRVAEDLMGREGPLVLTRPGLLARYQLDGFLQRVIDSAWSDEGPGVLLVVPTQAETGQAMIHGFPESLVIPTTTPAQRLKVPVAWLENADRGRHVPVSVGGAA